MVWRDKVTRGGAECGLAPPATMMLDGVVGGLRQ